MKNSIRKSLLAITLFAAAGVASAAVTVDFDTGTGFVGKGDVQDALGWNNAQLQSHADFVTFRVASVVTTEVTWVCTNSNNENTQERARTTTTTTAGVFTSEVRDKKQVTGFILKGFSGNPDTSSETVGNQLNSCPNGPWTLTTPAGEPEVIDVEGGVEVSVEEDVWHAL